MAASPRGPLEGDWLHTRSDLLPFDDPPAENVIAKVVGLERFGRQRPIPSAGLAARIFARAEQALGFVAAAGHLYAPPRHPLGKPVTPQKGGEFYQKNWVFSGRKVSSSPASVLF